MQGYSPIPQGQYPPPQQQGYIPPPAPGGYPQQGYAQPTSVGGYNPTQYQGQGYANQPMPQVGAVPPPNFGGIQYVYVPDPMAELAMSNGVLIRQQAQFLEQITGCESPNRYYVFSQSPQGGMKLLFKCKEYSDCCMRNCCSASSREFNMAVKHIATAANLDENYTTPFVSINKPFKCTCFCLDRPEMLIKYGANNQPLGRIKQPFTCWDPEFSLYDSTGNKKFIIHADCCQCGLLCANNFCGKLAEAVFNVYNASNTTAPCGTITKKCATASELVTSADSYQINFPREANPEDKMILIAAGLMIDYQFFEESASDKNNNTHHGGYRNY